MIGHIQKDQGLATCNMILSQFACAHCICAWPGFLSGMFNKWLSLACPFLDFIVRFFLCVPLFVVVLLLLSEQP